MSKGVIKKKIVSASIKGALENSFLPSLEKEWLLACLLKKPREFILSHPEKSISKLILNKFKKLDHQRRQGWPLAYLTGQQEFFGLDFIVNRHVLIPRPETEMLVEEICQEARQAKSKSIIVDLGTGSGAIIISTVKELIFPNTKNSGSHFPNLKFLAIDISPAALLIAKKNAQRHKVLKKINFKQSDLLEYFLNKLNKQQIIVAANLPYLTPQQIKNSPSISHEPRLALDGGYDGLKYYRQLLDQLTKISYKTAIIFMEIDPSQTIGIKALINQFFKEFSLKIIKDLSGQERLIRLKI